MPDKPYKADDRYPGWSQNEVSIAVDRVLAIASDESVGQQGDPYKLKCLQQKQCDYSHSVGSR
ncbi:MAG: hypothetical protein ACFBSF_05755 [Leptolyngbyaceae cyanobacterium]